MLYPEELADCEECFVTNSLMGIMPVRQLGKYTFSSGKTAKQLIEQYRKAVKNIIKGYRVASKQRSEKI